MGRRTASGDSAIQWRGVLLAAVVWCVGLTPRPARAVCVGDCDDNCAVTVDEIITGVNIVLGNRPTSACPSIAVGGEHTSTVADIITAVNNALFGCSGDVCAIVCGDGRVEADETCDDGGTCIGGANAGSACTSEAQCEGNGVCDAGTKPGYACAADSDCPDGRCVHCKTFGGDGCAANCTHETDIVMQLVPGQVLGLGIAPGGSGSVAHMEVITLLSPFTGSQLLTIGSERDGLIPTVIKASFVRIAPSPLSTLGAIGCLCWRGVAMKTCGGTLFNRDGTQSPDCTPGFTAGDSVCGGTLPCTSVYGDGNAAAGVIGCDGLQAVNADVTQDSGGSSNTPAAPVMRFSDVGPAGSAVLLSSAVLTNKGDNQCASRSPAYGRDQIFCTEDDPPSAPLRGVFPIALLTGTASGTLFNANGVDGEAWGPFVVEGSPFDCAAVNRGELGGAALAGAWVIRDTGFGGDAVITTQLVAQPGIFPTPRGTPTSPPTLTVTRTPTLTPRASTGIEIGSTSGHRGERVSLTVTLHAAPPGVAVIQEAITFPRGDISVVGCAANPEVQKNYYLSADNQTISFTIQDAPGVQRVAIPNGSVLFTCTFDIGAAAPFGTTILTGADPYVVAPSGHLVDTIVTSGAITVVGGPTSTPTQTSTGTPPSTPTRTWTPSPTFRPPIAN